MNRINKFKTFLESMKQHNSALIEAVKQVFNVCFENEDQCTQDDIITICYDYTLKADEFFEALYDMPLEFEKNTYTQCKVSECMHNIMTMIKQDYFYNLRGYSYNDIIQKFESALDVIKNTFDDKYQYDGEFRNYISRYDPKLLSNLKNAIKAFEQGDEGNEDGSAPYLDRNSDLYYE